MPLLQSPIDGSPMKQINRYGIEIDVCPTSGGIWLDKGELEKLMHFMREDTANQQYIPQQKQANHYNDYPDQRSDYDRRPRKKESRLEQIMDLFDF